jgi:hypothetical protein
MNMYKKMGFSMHMMHDMYKKMGFSIHIGGVYDV